MLTWWFPGCKSVLLAFADNNSIENITSQDFSLECVAKRISSDKAGYLPK